MHKRRHSGALTVFGPRLCDSVTHISSQSVSARINRDQNSFLSISFKRRLFCLIKSQKVTTRMIVVIFSSRGRYIARYLHCRSVVGCCQHSVFSSILGSLLVKDVLFPVCVHVCVCVCGGGGGLNPCPYIPRGLSYDG